MVDRVVLLDKFFDTCIIPAKMKEKYLVIVESPTKARTIGRFLPKNFIVAASIGHVRDLPQTAADIPAAYKDKAWSRLGINVEQDFEPLYTILKGKAKIIREIKQKMQNVQGIYLATDEDREGESISWHLVQILSPEKKKIPVRRMVFHEITKNAINKALEHTRDIDMDMVCAQETRRILDRLYGFTLSPLIWKKIAYGLSAGRVQSPGLRMIVERERERILFKKSVYWDVQAQLTAVDTGSDKVFEARLVAVKNKNLATSKDFHPTSGEMKNQNLIVLTKDEAINIEKSLSNEEWKVIDVSEKKSLSHPPPPFITSTLQQEGNRKLGLTARETMRTAQKLYEEGLITYMRTDSPTLSAEAIAGARKIIESRYGKDYLSDSPRQYSAKSKGAQEAHEAIRPAGSHFVHPDDSGLSGSELALYEAIWKRSLATQMASAQRSGSTVKIQVGESLFVARGHKILFPGFLKLAGEGSSSNRRNKDDEDIILPDLQIGHVCTVHALTSLRHETRPPARYTEASLIQNLEKAGIGRPSTYSSIISTLFDRRYIRKSASALVPSFTGMGVVQFLENNFKYLIEYGFTSDMESYLDRIAVGAENHLQYLQQFYSGSKGLKAQVEQQEQDIKPEESRRIRLPQAGEDVELRIGRFGPYLIAPNPAGGKVHASIPEDIAPADLGQEDIESLIEIQIQGPEPLGLDPESGKPIFLLSGRYGPYVQLGQASEDEPKPRRASVPWGQNLREVSVEEAVKYLSVPRILGTHPDSGNNITVAIGRYGPFVVHDDDFRSLKSDDDVYTIDLDRALELLSEEKSSGRRGSKLIKNLGELNKKSISLLSGKYGPYLKYGTKNISLPEERKSEEALKNLTFEEVTRIIKAQ